MWILGLKGLNETSLADILHTFVRSLAGYHKKTITIIIVLELLTYVGQE